MSKEAFVLLTAMPPHKGHLELIKFASALLCEGSLYYRDYNVTVLVCTQDGEPLVEQRFEAVKESVSNAALANVRVCHLHRTLPQEPGEDPAAFWDMWELILDEYGYLPGDYFVSSEVYGKEMSEALKGTYIPFDLSRSITPCKATQIRDDPRFYFEDILPEFRKYLKKTVTIFGAESVGKTTTAYMCATSSRNMFLHEWARPYLETVGAEVTTEKMQVIFTGQRALQLYGQHSNESEFVFQDTDLFSTLGYWEMWDKNTVPGELRADAQRLKSDLYVILTSDIPFEPDPLRYGGDVRETPDEYWIDLCERENLSYIVISDTVNRWLAVWRAVRDSFKNDYLKYQRAGKEYESD